MIKTGMVTNSYWATALEDAVEWLSPLAGQIRDLSVSSDLYHYDEEVSEQVRNAREAADALGVPIGFISVAQPEDPDAPCVTGQLPTGESGVMYQGRAAEKLAPHIIEIPFWRAVALTNAGRVDDALPLSPTVRQLASPSA